MKCAVGSVVLTMALVSSALVAFVGGVLFFGYIEEECLVGYLIYK